MTDQNTIQVLDHGYVRLRNISVPTRRIDQEFDAHDRDPANTARVSFDGADQPDRPIEQDMKLLDTLYRNRHTTPFEMIEIWLHMSMPIFVARQFVRHRTVSINEVSARYVQLPNKFYIPDPQNVGTKSASNKQGRDVGDPIPGAYDFRDAVQENSERAYEDYSRFIKEGIPNELARLLLPVNIYTTWIWKQDLHNILHFLKLRLDDHAQYEARQYAEAIFKLLSRVLPGTMRLFAEQELSGQR